VAQVGDQLAGALVAGGAVLLQAAGADVAQLGRELAAVAVAVAVAEVGLLGWPSTYFMTKK